MICLSDKYLPASLLSLITPAGDMWSVVIESPSISKGLALKISVWLFDSFSKNGGFFTYVELRDQLNVDELLTLIPSQIGSPLKISL